MEPLQWSHQPVVPGYTIVRKLGEGGLAVVYLATSDDAPDQHVAIKVLKQGLINETSLNRFSDEQKILGQLSHPHIASLLDQGSCEDGRPFFAMTYYSGEPLLHYIQQHRLTLEERLELFLKFADILAFSHRNLILHRDIKPSNVLVTAEGAVKLLDFGISKLLGEGDNYTVTMDQDRYFTPSYASPERVRGERLTVTSEVYSLGVLLYEMVTGTKPYVLGSSPLENHRIICEKKPLTPSRCLSNTHRGTLVPSSEEEKEAINFAVSWANKLKGELDTLIMKALAKEANQRYLTVEAMAEDVRFWLAGHPIKASPPTWRYRLNRFVKRNRILSASLLLLGMLLLLCLISLTVLARRSQTVKALALRENELIKKDREASQKLSQLMTDMFVLPKGMSGKGEEVTAKTILKNAVALTTDTEELKDHPELQVRYLSMVTQAFQNLGLFSEMNEALEKLLVIKEQALEPNDPSIGQTLLALCALARNRGELKKSYEYVLRAHAILKDSEDEFVRLRTEIQMVTLASQLGDTSHDLDPLVDKIFAAQQDDSFSPRQKIVFIDLMQPLLEQSGKSKEAVGLCTQFVTLTSEFFPQDQFLNYVGKRNLALSLYRDGQLDMAEKQAIEAIDFGKTVMPQSADPFETAALILAAIHSEKGNLTELVQLSKETAEKIEALNGRQYSLQSALGYQAEGLLRLGRFTEALQITGNNLLDSRENPVMNASALHAYYEGHILELFQETEGSLSTYLDSSTFLAGQFFKVEPLIYLGLGRQLFRLGHEDASNWAFAQAEQALQRSGGSNTSDGVIAALHLTKAHQFFTVDRLDDAACAIQDFRVEVASGSNTWPVYGTKMVLYALIEIWREFPEHLETAALGINDPHFQRTAFEDPILKILLSSTQHFRDLALNDSQEALEALERNFKVLCEQEDFVAKQALSELLMTYYQNQGRSQDAKRIEDRIHTYIH